MTEIKTKLVSFSEIPGLYLFTDFISEDEEKKLLKVISEGKWEKAVGTREVQQWGYKYNYSSKNSSPEKLDSLPSEFKDILDKLLTTRSFEKVPDQCIANKYEIGEGIAAHTDHIKHFGDRVASLTLNSDITMVMQRGEKKIEVRLTRRSMIVLTGEARYQWTHCIPARKNDIVDGIKIPRGVRTSLTFRNMIF